MSTFFRRLVISCQMLASVSLAAQPAASPGPSPAPQKVADGVIFQFSGIYLKLEVWGDNVIRVVSAKKPAFFNRSTPATEVRQREKASWTFATQNNVATLSTKVLQARVSLATGAVSFLTPKASRFSPRRAAAG